MPASEFDTIGVLARLFSTRAARRVASVGIGDDAAVLRAAPKHLVWTVDASVEGVHFDRRYLSLEEVGARSFHAAVSDVAAMGGRPLAALSSLVVPASLPARAVADVGRGQALASRSLHCPIIGGNVSRGRELSITTTVLGVAKRPLTRSGARRGDELWLLGDVGLAGAGLRLLAKRGGGPRPGRAHRSAAAACVEAWRSPRALIREGLSLVGRAHAALDVSDGLAGDAAHLAEASRVRVVVEEAALRRALRPELVLAAEMLRGDALGLALHGGEDYALVAAGPPGKRPRGALRIGRIEAGRGIVLEGADGASRDPGKGFDHFAARSR